MNKRPNNLTPIFKEIISTLRRGEKEMARSLVTLLPPKKDMGAASKKLLKAIEETYDFKSCKNDSGHSRIDFLTGTTDTTQFKWPKISVITPTFNQGKYIRETLESVLGQGYPDLEYIVIDGGSTDETVDIIEEYESGIYHWVSEKDNGQSNAINKGFKLATGEILTWLNSDDQFADDALFKMALAFKTSDAEMVAGICEIHEDRIMNHRHLTSCSDGDLPLDAILDLDKGWNAGQFFFQPEVFFTRDLWKKAGSHVREDCYYSMDYEMWCRFTAVGAKVHVIGTPIVNYRAHPEQKTAVPEKFHAELETVRETFIKKWVKGNRPLLNRPDSNSAKRVRVAMINDHGFKYGAGIAHQRIAAALDLGGFEIHVLPISDFVNEDKDLNEIVSEIMADLAVMAPDIVILGNLHSQWKKEADLVFEVQRKYRSYWLTHDFWLFTGRCAYVENCGKYLTGCDHLCPTAEEYPALPPQEISGAWAQKRQFLSACENLTVLAYSDYAKKFGQNYLDSFENNIQVERISLGVPVEKFFRMDKAEAKKKLNIDHQSFTVAFSVSSISEKRKGADFLEVALHMLASENITILLIGRYDEPMDLPDFNFITLGYVENNDILVEALNAADVFVGPSRAETLGQVFLEAAMCGIPSIGFAGSGVESAIVNNVTGILIRDQSAVQLAAAIKSLIDDRRHCELLGETAYLHAQNHFSLEACFKSFYELFKKQGLIDRWRLPHKISYYRESRLVGENPY